MANICDNRFTIACDNEEVLKQISKKLEDLFSDVLDGDITYGQEDFIEGYFESRWCFPDEIFNDFFTEFEDDSIYMRCLSEEYGCQYVAMNVYKDGSWWEPQTFDF